MLLVGKAGEVRGGGSFGLVFGGGWKWRRRRTRWRTRQGEGDECVGEEGVPLPLSCLGVEYFISFPPFPAKVSECNAASKGETACSYSLDAPGVEEEESLPVVTLPHCSSAATRTWHLLGC